MARTKALAQINGLNEDHLDALTMLFEAHQAARQLGAKPRALACQLSSLHDVGINDAVLRWLVTKKLVDHLWEITRPRQHDRAFREAVNLRFTSASCFVLTGAGVGLAERLAASGQLRAGLARKADRDLPHYDSERRKLFFKGKIVKQFKQPAANQEPILLGFEEEKWVRRLADPIPGQTGIDAKHRLNGAITKLNSNQINPILRFHGDGTGTGILWEDIS
jgi:hypothetical protein